jgi:hypothetical protein
LEPTRQAMQYGPFSTAPQERRRTARQDWIKRLAVKLLNRCLPELYIAAYCDNCRARLQLTDTQLSHWQECWTVEGTHFFSCPQCGDRSCRPFGPIGYHDTML